MSGPSDLYDWTPEQWRAVIHLESLLRERRAQQSPSPATAPGLPPDCLPLGHAVADEPSTDGAIA